MNMGNKSFLIAVVILVLLANVAHAVGSKLIFSDVDVKVGGKTSNNRVDGDTIGEEAEPGDSVEFRVKVQNNFTSAENLKIKDITVKVTIEGIDDGSDLDDESNSFDLSPGNDKRITLKFETPMEVDEDTFDVVIHTEGEDKNGTNHESEMRLKLEINKKSHMLKITKATLSPADVSCNRKSVQLAVNAINIGSEDEEDVTFSVLNSDLGIDLKDTVSELTAEPNQPESRFSKTYSLKVADDVPAGSYPITFTASYDDDRKKAEMSPALTVSDCATAKSATKSETKTSETNEGVEVITPATGRTTAAVQNTTPAGTTVTQESFFKSNAFVVGIIIAEIVAVLVGIALVVSLFRRRA